MKARSRLVDETFTISRFTVIGLLATATHAVVGSGAVFLGAPVLLANALGFLVAWTVSFHGHYHFTFGQPSDIRVARTRFIVISLVLFAISQLTVTLLQTTDTLSAWIEPVIGAIVVPPASYLLYRLYVFAPAPTGARDRAHRFGPLLGRSLRLHRLLVPFCLFGLFYSFSALDPTDVGWLTSGDLGQHFGGWTAFRYDDWNWPIGLSKLVAHPSGVPLTVTDSNPLLAIPLKIFSRFMPTYFQFIGIWYLLCLVLSYNIVFNLLTWLSNRPLAALFGTVLVIAMPFFFQRYGHDTLMAHWLIFASISVVIRTGSDRRAVVKHAGIIALCPAVHPYFLPMTLAIAGMDLLRRVYRRHGPGRDLGAAVTDLVKWSLAIVAPALAVAAMLGFFSFKTTRQPVGIFTMDPFAWFNGRDYSLFLNGWPLHAGQYEGVQYPGLGTLIAVIVAMVLWIIGLARPPERLRSALPWLLPAVMVLFALAVSPIIWTFGINVMTIDVTNWPVVGYVYSAFRSSGRFGWPATYLLVLTSVALLLTIRSRAVVPILAALVVLQLIDISPVAERTRHATAHREIRFQELENTDVWRRLIDASDRIYASDRIGKPMLLELGLIAFPQGKSLNRYYFAQDLNTFALAEASALERRQVLSGELSDRVLYLVDPAAVGGALKGGTDLNARLQVLDGQLIIAPAAVRMDSGPGVQFKPGPAPASLARLVEDCDIGCALILSVKDESTRSLPVEFVELVEARGGTIGSLAYRGSYAAILVDGRVVEEGVSADADVLLSAEVFGNDVSVVSGGYSATNRSSITVNGLELSPNTRGINIVRLEPAGVSAINAFDTYEGGSALVP